MNYIPARPTGDCAESRYHQAVWDLLFGNRSLFIPTPQLQFEKHTQGYLPKIAIPTNGGGSSGWRDAVPLEYDYNLLYSAHEIVVVSATNVAVTAGASNGTPPADGGKLTGVDGSENGAPFDKATAGVWKALRTPVVLSAIQPAVEDPPLLPNYDVHVPAWPMPNADIDSPDNYWLLVGFIPVLQTFCDADGNPVDYYVQGVPVPVPL